MHTITSISEEQHMHITAIIASIPRETIDDFKKSISTLKPEELRHLKQELSMLVTKGRKDYLAALDSL